MSEDNRPPPDILPLVLVVAIGIGYQNRETILKAAERLVYQLMYVGIYLGIAGGVCALLYLAGKSLQRKYLRFCDWMAKVDLTQKQHLEKLQMLAERIAWLDGYDRARRQDINTLRAEIAKLVSKFEPKKDKVKEEAKEKVEEAVREITGAST